MLTPRATGVRQPRLLKNNNTFDHMPRLTPKQWREVGKQYRAGQVSVMQIAKQFGISNTAVDRHAKIAGWTRDLTKQTKDAVTAGAIAAAVPDSGEMSNEQIVEEFALVGVNVIMLHRRDIQALRTRREALMRRYDALTALDSKGVERINDLEAVALAANILESVARTDQRIVLLERIAFNLNTDDDDEEKTIRIIGGLPSSLNKAASGRAPTLEHQPKDAGFTDVDT